MSGLLRIECAPAELIAAALPLLFGSVTFAVLLGSALRQNPDNPGWVVFRQLIICAKLLTNQHLNSAQAPNILFTTFREVKTALRYFEE